MDHFMTSKYLGAKPNSTVEIFKKEKVKGSVEIFEEEKVKRHCVSDVCSVFPDFG